MKTTEKTMLEKTCLRCNMTKPCSDFSRNRNQQDGLQPQCKFCNSEINHARRKAKGNNTEAARRALREANAHFSAIITNGVSGERYPQCASHTYVKIAESDASRASALATLAVVSPKIYKRLNQSTRANSPSLDFGVGVSMRGCR